MTVKRERVLDSIHQEGPSAARQRFGDAIVSDVIVHGIRAATKDCGDGPCSCGGYGHVHPAHANDREARQAARRAAVADAARAGVADAITKHQNAARTRAFLSSGRRAR